MKLSPSSPASLLIAAVSALGVAISAQAPKKREQVRAESAEVRVELPQAGRTGDSVGSGATGQTLREIHPHQYR